MNTVSEKSPTVKFITFYPDNNTWEFQGDSNKPAYATFELRGHFVLKIDRKIVVVEAIISPSRTTSLLQEGNSGQFSTMQISEGDGLAPSLVGIEPRSNFELDASGFSILYLTDLTEEDIEDWLGAEDLNPENISKFIELLKENKIPVVRRFIQMGTIADKE